MKKLGKKNITKHNTVEAYMMACKCPCSCSCGTTYVASSYGQGIYQTTRDYTGA